MALATTESLGVVTEGNSLILDYMVLVVNIWYGTCSVCPRLHGRSYSRYCWDEIVAWLMQLFSFAIVAFQKLGISDQVYIWRFHKSCVC